MTMVDAWTVARKELLELLGERQSLRGALFQTAGTVVTTGVVVPALDASMWNQPSTLAMLYFVFPCMVAASVAADSFAGERERKTLETLLATPLSDSSIFVGKASNSVAFSFAVSVLSLTLGLTTANILGRVEAPFILPAEGLAAILGGALAAALVTSSLAIFVSARVNVARAVQQIVPICTMLFVAALNFVLQRQGLKLDWSLLLRIDCVLLALGSAGLWYSAMTFKRNRVFEAR